MAQPNMFGVAEFDQDPETAAELMRLKRQQQIADAMYGQSQQPLQGGMAGQVYVPPSITQGLAKLMQGYVSGKSSEGVQEGYKGLASRKQQEMADAIAAYKRGTMGTPEQPMGPPTPEGEMGVKPAFSPTPDARRQAIIEAAVSTNPRLSKMGQMDFQMDAQKEAKQDAIKARMEELQLRLAEGRISKEEADKRAADLRREMQEAGFAQQRSMAQLAADLRQPPAPIQVTDASGNVKLVDQRGNLIKDLGAVGKPSAGFEKAGAAKKKLSTDLDMAISELEKATKDGGLIDKSTGSGAGALVDAAAGFFGKATPGSIAVGQMKPIFDLVLKMVPRFEGPQSDKDTTSYREAAGELANPATPNERKKVAGKEILRLMRERKGQFIDKSVEGTEADVPASGFKVLGVEQ